MRGDLATRIVDDTPTQLGWLRCAVGSVPSAPLDVMPLVIFWFAPRPSVPSESRRQPPPAPCAAHDTLVACNRLGWSVRGAAGDVSAVSPHPFVTLRARRAFPGPRKGSLAVSASTPSAGTTTARSQTLRGSR